jgi:hypothetical protein
MALISLEPLTGKAMFPGVLLLEWEIEQFLVEPEGWLARNWQELQRIGFPGPVKVPPLQWDAGAVYSWRQAMRGMGRVLPTGVPATRETAC